MNGGASTSNLVTRKELKETWNGLPLNYNTCLKILKRDAVFCDYFNAFLSLPAFARPLYYERSTASLLEVYRDCKIPVVGITIQAPIPEGEVQELLQRWLLKTRLPMFLKTSLYVECTLCQQLLRVSGAVPDRDDSEEELTESESDGDNDSDVVEKERHVLDIAGLDRNSRMSTVEGLSTPLLQMPKSPEQSTIPSLVEMENGDGRPDTTLTDPERVMMHRKAKLGGLLLSQDLIALSSTTLFEGGDCASSELAVYSAADIETVTTSAPSGRKSLCDAVKLPEISSAPVTTQLSPVPPTAPLSPRQQDHKVGGVGTHKESGVPHRTLFTSPSTGVLELEQRLIPDILSNSITDMLPDSQSDMASPHVWQRLYKTRTQNNQRPPGTPSPVPSESLNELFPEIPLSKQERKNLLGSVSGMDSFREFLSRTAGEHLLTLWLDITQIEKMLVRETDVEKRVGYIRDLQDKYRTRLTKSAKDRLSRREFGFLESLKGQVQRKLQLYWVPRYFQMKIQNHKVQGPLRLDLDEELIKLPFLPTAAVSRSYPSQLTNLTAVINDTEDWSDMFKEHDSRIISGRLRNISASIVGSKKEHFTYGIRSDKNAGGPFRQWLERNGNTELLNVLSFCEEVSQYRVYEERKADRGILKRLGWNIWHMYMAPGARYSVGLGPAVTSDIRIALLSTKDYVPYTIFDVAKGNLMLFLKRGWKEYIQVDYEDYLQARPDIMEQIRILTENRIRQMQGNRINQHRKRYRAHRHRRGKKKQLHTVFDSASEGELEEEDFENMSIPQLGDTVANRQAMEKFGSWATQTLTGDRMHTYVLWNDLKSYFEISKQGNKHLRSLQAEHIHRTHFANRDKKSISFPVEIQSKISREQGARPQSPLLNRAMTFCEPAIEKAFDEFIQALPLAQATLRRRNTSDDLNSNMSQQSFVIGGRRRGRGGKNKKVPGRATPTKELYHRLLNLLMSVTSTWPEELLLFERYLGEHGADDGYPLIVNDLHFWVEVQRFKDMYHGDTDSDFIYKKLEAIVDCYLDPQIPTDPVPEKPPNMSPAISPTPSMVSKGHSSGPDSPVQSKVDMVSLTEKAKKLPWAQRKQVDLTVDIGQKIASRLTQPGAHLDKDMSTYDEAQKMVLKELVPFYAGFVNAQDLKSATVLSECKVCDPEIARLAVCHAVNRKWVGSPDSTTVMLFPLPSPSTNVKQRHVQSNKEHFTFTLEHGVTWTKTRI